MKVFFELLFIFGLIAISTQENGVKKCGCQCHKPQTIVGAVLREIEPQDEPKPGCSLCEKRKEMLRLEREKQKKIKSCPFEILGDPVLKGKASDEVFDDFRELIVPSQNGFFDMMRGIVKKMHVTSETELQWAKEKEAKMLEKQKKLEKEEKKRKKDEFRGKLLAAIRPKPCPCSVPEEKVSTQNWFKRFILPVIRHNEKDLKETFIPIRLEEYEPISVINTNTRIVGEYPEQSYASVSKTGDLKSDNCKTAPVSEIEFPMIIDMDNFIDTENVI